MKLSKTQMQQLSRRVIDFLKEKNQIVFKAPEEKVYQRAFELVQGDYEREAQLDKEVNLMLDDLEQKNPGEFQRYKMFPLLKKKLAQEKRDRTVILSEDRQSHLAHVITDGIWKDDIVDFVDDDQAVRLAKQAVVLFVKESADIDQVVRSKVASLKRGVVEGSPEWDVMYRKYYEEELNRRG